MIRFLNYLIEMTTTHLAGLQTLLNKLFRRHNLNVIITTHALHQLSFNPDKTRVSISASDVYESMVKFCEKQQPAFEKYRARHKEYIAIITHITSNLNIVVSIDYDDKRIKDFQPHNLKIITAMVKKDFGSDNYPNSIRVYVD